jgi:hypothetical protein
MKSFEKTKAELKKYLSAAKIQRWSDKRKYSYRVKLFVQLTMKEIAEILAIEPERMTAVRSWKWTTINCTFPWTRIVTVIHIHKERRK